MEETICFLGWVWQTAELQAHLSRRHAHRCRHLEAGWLKQSGDFLDNLL